MTTNGGQVLSEISNLKQAIEYFHQKTNNCARTAGIINGKYGPIAHVFIIRMPNEENGLGVNRRFHVFFKRDWLFKGDLLFNIQTGGYWQSLNYEGLKRAAQENAVIVIIMRYGGFYKIEAKDWLHYAETNHTIRNPSTEAGFEASIPRYRLEELIAEPEGPAKIGYYS